MYTKIKFAIKHFFRKWEQIRSFPVDTRRLLIVYKTSLRRHRRCIDVLEMLKRRWLFIFTKEIFNEKLDFMCHDNYPLII